MATENRKGARRIAEIPPEILAALNKGELETANLMEWLAVDQLMLLKHLLAEVGALSWLSPIEQKVQQLKKSSPLSTTMAIGESLAVLDPSPDCGEVISFFSRHRSDIARNWAASRVGHLQLPISVQLELIKPFADDANFGVKEIAWLALRKPIANNLSEAIDLLQPWALHSSSNIRRFASEATRPRGVWCAHISQLKDAPWVALPILEPLKADGAKYVQDSVANWLNDASKTHPLWVKGLLQQWQEQTNNLTNTLRIAKRAARSLEN